MAPQNQLESTFILETQGLLAALEQLTKEIAGAMETDPVPIHLEADSTIEKLLDQEAQSTIFRVVLEALANACKHAQANNLYVRLYQRGTDVITEIEDDGIGFDVAAVEARYAEHEPGSSERPDPREGSALVKGKASIQSAPGQGTKITVTIPI